MAEKFLKPSVDERYESAPDDVRVAFEYLKNGDHDDVNELTEALHVYCAWLVPPWCEGIDGDFWLTEHGQVLAAAQWVLYHDQALTLASASRRLGWGNNSRGMVRVRDALPLYHYPNMRSWGGYYVLASDVDKIKERSV